MKAWLLRVCMNCCTDVSRSPHRSRTAPLETAGDVPDADACADAAGQHAGEGETLDALEAALDALPEGQRAAVHLFYYEGYSTDEVAQILGVAPATARSHLHRARNALRVELDAGGGRGNRADEDRIPARASSKAPGPPRASPRTRLIATEPTTSARAAGYPLRAMQGGDIR